MLITFKSDATADVIMLGKQAQRLLEILGKDPNDAKGIITVSQLPEAIARLKAAIEEERQRLIQAEQEAQDDAEEADREAGRVGMNAAVNLAQRAWPLLDLIQRSLAEEVPVVWGS